MKEPTDPTARESDRLATVARGLMAREGACGETASGVAAGAAQATETLCSHLGRVVGPLGISALFVRSVVLTRQRFPWLVVDAHAGRDGRWQSLRSCLEAQQVEAAREASLCLVTHVLRLLGGLIGDALVLRLLAEVWPDDVPTSQPESKEVTS